MSSSSNKTLILGGANITDIDYVRNWVKSAKLLNKDKFEIALLIYQFDEQILKDNKELFDGVFMYFINHTSDTDNINNVIYDTGISNPTNSKDLIHHLRFFHYWQLLSNQNDRYQNVIITDVKDVVFNQSLERIVDNKLKTILVADECVQFEFEPWNKNNLITNFGPIVYDSLKDSSVLCCGVIAGNIEDVSSLCLLIYQIASGKFVADQSGLNVITYLNKSYSEMIEPTTLFLQCHTRMKSQYANLTDEHYELDLNTIDDFPIIHQYERIPELNSYIQFKYRN